jgi:hypothetical protein
VLHAQVAGRAINLVTPLASLGEATKVTLLMRDTDGTRAVAAIARFGMVYVIINLAMIIVGAPVCALALPLPGWLDAHAVARHRDPGGARHRPGAHVVRGGLVARAVAGLRRVRLVSAARAAGAGPRAPRTSIRRCAARRSGRGGPGRGR